MSSHMENLCTQNSTASQTKEVFWHASFQNIYLLCTWKGNSLSPAKDILQQNEDENQERGRNWNQKTVNLTQDVSLQSDHYPTGRLTPEWPLSRRPISDESTWSQTLWFCAVDIILEKLECLRNGGDAFFNKHKGKQNKNMSNSSPVMR